MSAALGLKVRTVVSLYLWDLFRTRALGEPGSEGVRRTGRRVASRWARHRGHADAHGRQVRIPACAEDGKAKSCDTPLRGLSGSQTATAGRGCPARGAGPVACLSPATHEGIQPNTPGEGGRPGGG